MAFSRGEAASCAVRKATPSRMRPATAQTSVPLGATSEQAGGWERAGRAFRAADGRVRVEADGQSLKVRQRQLSLQPDIRTLDKKQRGLCL